MKVTWASHYSQIALDKHFEVGVSSLLPLLKDQAHDVATIKHALDKIKEALLFFHTLSGCDTVSASRSKGKKSFFPDMGHFSRYN